MKLRLLYLCLNVPHGFLRSVSPCGDLLLRKKDSSLILLLATRRLVTRSAGADGPDECCFHAFLQLLGQGLTLTPTSHWEEKPHL